MDVYCPGCGRPGRIATPRPGMALTCPACKRRWTLPVGGRGAAETTAPARRPRDDGARLARWAVPCGIAVLVGLALPLVTPSFSVEGTGLAVRWSWDLWEAFDSATKTSAAVLAAIALLWIGVSRVARESARAGSLLVLALGALVVHALSSDASFGFGGAAGVGFPLLFLGIGAAGAVAAAANRVRKSHPDVAWVRFVVAAAGAVGVGLFFLPTARGGPALSSVLFSAESWSADDVAVTVALAAAFAFLASALLHLVPGRGLAATSAVSTLARVAAIALPLAALVGAWIAADESPVEATIVAGSSVLKSPVLTVYPALIVLGLALVPLARRLAAPGAAPATERESATAPAAPPRPAPSERAAPVRTEAPAPAPSRSAAPAARDPDPDLAEMRRRLARLKSAHDEGLLTEAEYASKRKEIVGDYEF